MLSFVPQDDSFVILIPTLMYNDNCFWRMLGYKKAEDKGRVFIVIYLTPPSAHSHRHNVRRWIAFLQNLLIELVQFLEYPIFERHYSRVHVGPKISRKAHRRPKFVNIVIAHVVQFLNQRFHLCIEVAQNLWEKITRAQISYASSSQTIIF